MSDTLSGATVSTSWVYDKQGRVSSQSDTIPGASALTTSWTYDAMSRARAMTYPDGEVITTTYDVQGPKSLTVYVSDASYNAAGQLTTLNLGNGLTTGYTYNPQNMRLTQLTTGTFQNTSYQYDNVGNVKTITDTARSEISNFVYDDLDRLKDVTSPYTQGWEYNAIGNITSRTGVNAAPFSYNDSAHKHAVTQVGSAYYCYDANGNMTKKAATNAACTTGGSTLSYNQENRLTQVISGTVQTDYVYNGDGARVKKTVSGTATYYVGNWYEVTNGVVTKYYYFGAQRVAMKQGSTLTYLHGDHLGSTSVASTDTGGFHSRQTYYAFGVPRTTEGTLPTDYTFTGQKYDSSDALNFYNARYYDSAIGRFTQPDTIVPNQYNPQSLNRYAYVQNNPVRYTDPTGHRLCEDGYCDDGREDDGGGGGGEPGTSSPNLPVKTKTEQNNFDLFQYVRAGYSSLFGQPQPLAVNGNRGGFSLWVVDVNYQVSGAAIGGGSNAPVTITNNTITINGQDGKPSYTLTNNGAFFLRLQTAKEDFPNGAQHTVTQNLGGRIDDSNSIHLLTGTTSTISKPAGNADNRTYDVMTLQFDINIHPANAMMIFVGAWQGSQGAQQMQPTILPSTGGSGLRPVPAY